MKQLWIIFIGLIMTSNLFANDSNIRFRAYYYNVCLEKTSVEEFESYLALHKDRQDITAKSYRSVIWFLWADYYFNPFKKWNCFLKGKDTLEHLINNYSNNIELRFLRLTIQENLPKILGYNENIIEDKTFINNNLHIVSDQDLFSRITSYLDDQKLTNTN
ncbi:MAG: hypothetical protein P8Q14_03835 [Vicingaceae bacterium]|nr:hypothetical protein [Vicingaceae bacterium]